MEIKIFEAYNYKGSDLLNIDRKKPIKQIIDIFTDQEICGQIWE